jgi:hypothetical protein
VTGKRKNNKKNPMIEPKEQFYTIHYLEFFSSEFLDFYTNESRSSFTEGRFCRMIPFFASCFLNQGLLQTNNGSNMSHEIIFKESR